MLTCPSWENLCEHWALRHIFIKAASELVFIFQVNGIEEFFRPTCLNGEHQMYCDRCGHKVDATIVNEDFFVISEHWYWFNEIITKWHTLKTHIFHSDRCNKTSPRCFDSAAEEVWVQLQLHVLLQNQLFCGGSLQPANTGGIYKVYFNIWSKSSSFFFLTLLFFVLCDQSEVYELYAVVDHFGGLRGGHYSATIKTQDEDRWYKFDDTQVTPVRLIAFSSV